MLTDDVLDRILAVSAALMASRNPQAVLESIVDASVALVGAERGCIFNRVDGKNSLELLVGKTSGGEPLDPASVKVSRSVLNRVDRSGESVAVADTEQHDELSLTASVQDLRLRSILCTPLRNAGERLGVLYLDSRLVSLPFGDQHLRLLQAFTAHAGAAIANARSYQALKDLNTTLERRVWERTQELVLASEELRASEERYSLSARGANDGLWDWKVSTGELYLSPRWTSMLGYYDGELGKTFEAWLGIVHPDDRARLEGAIRVHLDGRSPQLHHEYRIRNADGTYRWVLCRGVVVNSGRSGVRMAGSQTDVSERKLRDPLTGLANLTLFMDRLERVIARCVEHPQSRFGVLSVDLDNFGVLQNTLGATAGDHIVVEVARRLHATLRPTDTVARVARDDFLVLIEEVDAESTVTRLAHRIQDSFARPLEVNGELMFSSASIGIATSATGYREAEEVVRDAQAARARGKQVGKGRCELFDHEIQSRLRNSLRLESDLRRAIEDPQFVVHYQPIVRVDNGAITGFEALVRWQHPDRGLLSPAAFIPFAESSELILPIGSWVARTACRQLRAWHDCGARDDLVMAVNVSAKQLSQTTLTDEIEQVLRETALEPRNLKLEITESSFVDSVEAMIRKLADLKSLDVRLSIDDFGTGYSCLSYLQRFPIDTLKIDRSFVSGLGTDPQSLAITRTIINLAHNLCMDVVAEGVETETQLQCLRELGCEYAQGYYFCEPLCSEAAQSLLLERGSERGSERVSG